MSVYFDRTSATTPGAAPGVPALVFSDLNFASSNITLAFEGNAFPSPSVTNFDANFDPIRGGTTYSDVAPATSSTTPEPATWSLMAGVLVAFALVRAGRVVAVRRRAERE